MNMPVRSALLAAGLLAAVGVAPALDRSAGRAPVAHASAAPIGAYFVPIASYRALDTREDGAPPLRVTLTPTSRVPIEVFVQFEEGGDPDPKFPDEAVAVTYNVAVTETVGGGFLQVDGFQFATGSTSTVNWTGDGVTIANSGVAQLTEADGEPAALGLQIGGGPNAATHVVLDITGYYMPLTT
jgi:hypothetical protein